MPGAGHAIDPFAMHAHASRWLLAIAVMAIAAPALAQPQARSCELPTSTTDPLLDRAGLLAQYERLPHACLRELFTECNRASRNGILDFGSAAACSFGYEALLSQHFGGDFRALLAWWSAQQQAAQP